MITGANCISQLGVNQSEMVTTIKRPNRIEIIRYMRSVVYKHVNRSDFTANSDDLARETAKHFGIQLTDDDPIYDYAVLECNRYIGPMTRHPI